MGFAFMSLQPNGGDRELKKSKYIILNTAWQELWKKQSAIEEIKGKGGIDWMVGENLRQEVTKLSLEKNGRSGRRESSQRNSYVQGPKWERK